jgi:ribosomal protein S18 acetylase RimI-like enzyme
VNIHRIEPPQIQAAFELLAAHGWAHRLADLTHFAQLVAASQIAEVAVADGRVIGFVRGITDGLSNGYLSMVVVAPQHRGRGIGRQMVEHAVAPYPSVTWVLRAAREGANGFFAQLGFTPSTVAMERPRT